MNIKGYPPRPQGLRRTHTRSAIAASHRRAPIAAAPSPGTRLHFVALGHERERGQLYVIWEAENGLGKPTSFALTRRELRNEWLRRITASRPEMARQEPPGLTDVSAKIDRDRRLPLEPNVAGPAGESLTRDELCHFFARERVLPTPEGLAALRAGTWAEHAAAVAEAAKPPPDPELARVVLCASADCKNRTTAAARYCDPCREERARAKEEREARGALQR